MISAADVNLNESHLSIENNKNLSELNQVVNEWVGNNEIEKPLDKLFYQLANRDIQEWNVAFLDKLVVVSHYSIGYNEYLHQSSQFRSFQHHSFKLETPQTVDIEDLIPKWDGVRSFQIYEIKIR